MTHPSSGAAAATGSATDSMTASAADSVTASAADSVTGSAADSVTGSAASSVTASTAGSIALMLAVEHPAYAGHFPGAPIMPGVVLLDHALHAIGTALGIDAATCRIGSVKFLQPVRPGEAVLLHYARAADGSIAFTLETDGARVASGSVRMPDAGAS